MGFRNEGSVMRLDEKGREMIGGMGCEGEPEKNRRGQAWEREKEGEGKLVGLNKKYFVFDTQLQWVARDGSSL